jgi:hypothetical protein
MNVLLSSLRSGAPKVSAPSAQRIICLGHSHTNAIAAAGCLENDNTVTVINLRKLDSAFSANKENFRVDPEVVQLVGDGDGPIFSIVGGNKHNFLGLVRHPRPFDFVLPKGSALPLDPNAELIPFGSIKEVVERHAQRAKQQLQALAGQFEGRRLIQLESPPPATEAKVHEFPMKFGEQVRQYGVAPVGLRHRIWRLYSTVIRTACVELGIEFLPVPPESMDEQGCLRPELTANATHGNAQYGTLLLARMRAAIA